MGPLAYNQVYIFIHKISLLSLFTCISLTNKLNFASFRHPGNGYFQLHYTCCLDVWVHCKEFYMQNLDRDICKWCRPRSDSAERGVQSRSAYLLKLQEVKGYMKQTVLSPFTGQFSQQFTQPTLRDKRRTSTISTLIFFIFFLSKSALFQIILESRTNYENALDKLIYSDYCKLHTEEAR